MRSAIELCLCFVLQTAGKVISTIFDSRNI